MSKKIDLVFRSVGERTAALSLELAKEAVRPDRIEIIENVRPFSEALRRMLALEHDADYVVYVDADCLIFDDLRAFVERTGAPYVDCLVTDLFRGRIHCGVHVTRADVVRAMGTVEIPTDDTRYVIRPEARRRALALKTMGLDKDLRNFDILHDHFQHYHDIFAKYGLRELRSRTPHQRARLGLAMALWPEGDEEPDFVVARAGVAHGRATVPEDASGEELQAAIEALPAAAAAAVRRLGLPDKGPLERAEVEAYRARHPERLFRRPGGGKVFGIGLSRTGTRSLNMALQILGIDSIHYPADRATFEDLARGSATLRVLEDHDAVTDITVAPYYAQLDKRYPGSKFVLTVREMEGWLASARNHWNGRPAHGATRQKPGDETYMEVRRLLRAAVYGCYEFEEDRFRYVYETHLRNVLEHFEGRPDDLLVLDVCGGQGWPELCAFLGRPVPAQPFPHKGKGLSARLAGKAPTEED